MGSVSDEKLLAQCGCGKLKVELDGVTESRFLCCCSECQRRTGSLFSSSWYYITDTARHLEGDYGAFPRVGTKGTRYNFHFCTSYASTSPATHTFRRRGWSGGEGGGSGFVIGERRFASWSMREVRRPSWRRAVKVDFALLYPPCAPEAPLAPLSAGRVWRGCAGVCAGAC